MSDESEENGILPEAIFEGALAFLEEICAVSSESGDREGLHRAAGLLATALEERGLDAAITEEAAGDGLPVLHARGARDPEHSSANGGEERGAGALLLIGHLDTVLPAAPPHRESGRLRATGAIDMKGGLATLIGALDLLAERGVEPPADLHLVVVPDEEVGGEVSRGMVAAWGARARALWVLEPGEEGAAPGAETLVAGRRGLLNWRLEARGRAAHSGLHYWDGRSALVAAARWSAAAEGLSHRGGGPTVNVGRLVAGDGGFVDGLAKTPDLLGSDRQLNVVPDRAVAEGEARFLSAAGGDEIAHALAALAHEIAEATGTELRFTLGQRIAPVDPHGPQRSWCERAVALAARRGWRLEVEEERGGISFPNFLPDPGRIPVLDGLGPVGGGMHTREEFVDLQSLGRRIVLLADLLEADATERNA